VPGASGYRILWSSWCRTRTRARSLLTAMAGTAAVGAVVHLLATAIEEGRDLSSMSGILADSSYRLLPA
jgi:hypothetical protein